MSEERKAAERLAVKALGAIILIGLAFLVVPQVWDKLSPFIIAIPLAAMLQPVIRFAQERLKIKRGITVLVCVLLILGLLIGIMTWGVSIVLEQAPQVVGQSGNMLNEATNTIQQAFENLMDNATDNFNPQVQEYLRRMANEALVRASDWASDMVESVVNFTVNMILGLPYGVIYVSFLAMALYFITIHYNEIRSYLPGGKRRRQDSNTTQLTNSALRSLMGYLRVQGTFAVMVLVVSLIALNCFRFKYASALAVIAGVMEMIPMVGSGLMYILMSVVLFLSGSTTAGIQVLVLTGVLQLLRRILEPKLMSNSIGISPLLSLIGMFVGMRFGGILGLIGGPVAMSVLVGAVRGDVFKKVNDDMILVVEWFKRRWAKPETEADPPSPKPEKTEPADPNGEKSPAQKKTDSNASGRTGRRKIGRKRE